MNFCLANARHAGEEKQMKGKGEYGTGREGNCTPRQNPGYVSGD
jgi:hypothetical protein